ncbi:glycosyltransferase [Mongoliitalea lutea]|uniref:Glycosyl transferase family 1 domain-containing protein n=1 Tax=Mongoliitalea lutea TaxID=849756 RepID=A0A8J3CWC9_9BACT|nr:glycosyltransferase [Mongoliitalea lutea]GHB28980.1 hypothetical protein GCM10008106_07190 [Mongoliitalea lutea]
MTKQPAQILTVTTWELLPAAIIGKFWLNYRLIYDVQENYAKNIRWNLPEASKFKKYIQQLLIRSIENLSKPWIDQYILAEYCYRAELPHFQPVTLLPNTFPGKEVNKSNIRIPRDKPIRFLITGTLTPVYGTIEGIYWFKSLIEYHSNVELIIFGHCPLKSFEHQLIEKTYNKKKIHLTLSQEPISYAEILEQYEQADLVMLPYHLIPSIAPKFPSKIYECMALKKPMLLPENDAWKQLIEPHQAGLCIDFQKFENIPNTIEAILSTEFYTTPHIPEALWSSSEPEFYQMIEGLEPLKKG